jgi:hypothetical protein
MPNGFSQTAAITNAEAVECGEAKEKPSKSPQKRLKLD